MHHGSSSPFICFVQPSFTGLPASDLLLLPWFFLLFSILSSPWMLHMKQTAGGAGQNNDSHLQDSFSFISLNSLYLYSTVFWNGTPCSLTEVCWRFRRTYCHHLHGWSVNKASNKHNIGSKQKACDLLGSFFNHEDGSSMFLLNIRESLPHYMMPHPTR